MSLRHEYDFIVIGSGFGGSVAALRLTEKGYRVLVLEKGRRLGAKDFPRTNWDLRRWLWWPALRFFGPFRIDFLRHVTILRGIGVGGGSLVYANVLAIPKRPFFQAPTWAHLADWEAELRPFYRRALRMLGAVPNPRLELGDRVLRQMAREMGKEEGFEPTVVGVYFGRPGETVPDPYFGGRGPDRTGCTFCGGCMLGCRYNAKNTLDKNYLYLAEAAGARIQAESEAVDVIPLDPKGRNGYRVVWRPSTARPGRRKLGSATCRGVVFAGGVMGTVPLLLKLKRTSLPNLSDRVGWGVRTNSESLVGVTVPDRRTEFSTGIAIGSILHTDPYSHLEPVRYSPGAGFWRLFMAPMIHGPTPWARLRGVLADLIRHPLANLRVFLVDDWSRRTQILLYMRALEGTLRLVLRGRRVSTALEGSEPPTAFIPEAKALAERFARRVGGKPMVMFTETLFGIPTTAHILGGAVMGRTPEEGVIDAEHRVFGYENLFVCDGSAVSANPGVNPSLTILALAERAMDRVPGASG